MAVIAIIVLMCFSPEASFIVSGTLAATSAAIAHKPKPKRERFMALIPLIFAIQQFFEGIVWLYVGNPGPWLTIGTYIFVSIAFLFWPVYVPFAVQKAEKDPARKRMMTALLVAGVLASIWFLQYLLASGVNTRVDQQCLQYSVPMPWTVGLLYWLGANGALLLSSNRFWVLGGLLSTTGALIAQAVYPFAVASIWCYFAAVICLVIAVDYFKNATRGE